MRNPSFLTVSSCVLAGALLMGCGGKDDAEQAAPQTNSSSGAQVANTEPAKTQMNTDTHPGKALHDANCISCHDSAVYTREDRKIGDFPKLVAQVKRCDANLGSRLFDEEIEQVADYLNLAYYKYAK